MYQSMLPVWIGFYAWGLESRIKNVKGLTNPILAGIVVVIEIIEAYFSLKHGCPANFACSQIRVSSFLLALVIIKLFIGVQRSTVDNRFFKALAYLGDRSYGIYYIHYFFILLCAKVCKSVTLSFFGINWLSQSALSFVMALLGSLIAISVGRKLLSYLGIERVAEILGF